MDQQAPGAATRKIFVSLPKLFPTEWVTEWVWLVLNTTQSLGVNARVYHGIPKSLPPQTNIAEYEWSGFMFIGCYYLSISYVTKSLDCASTSRILYPVA
jgi:hypothetical protein